MEQPEPATRRSPSPSTEAAAPSPSARLATGITDAFYTAVGLGVLAVNRVQVARRDAARAAAKAREGDSDASAGGARLDRLIDAARQVRDDPESLRVALARLQQEIQAVDDLAQEVGRRIGEIVDRVEPDLPDGVRDLVGITRETLADLSTQYRAVLGLRAI